MKAFFEEFKKFALRGNVMDMAVGIIVGAAFTAIVTSLVDDLLSPLLGLLVRVNFSDLKVTALGATFAYGNFIIRAMNRISSLGKKEEEAKLTTKECPFCKSEIAIEATRCPNCTSHLEEKEQI